MLSPCSSWARFMVLTTAMGECVEVPMESLLAATETLNPADASENQELAAFAGEKPDPYITNGDVSSKVMKPSTSLHHVSFRTVEEVRLYSLKARECKAFLGVVL